MAIWDKILGKKDEKPDSQAVEQPRAVSESAKPSEEKVLEKGTLKITKEKRAGITGVLVAPHMTEKATDLATRGVYILRVATGATKRTVAEAVAGRYGVAVERVRMMVQPAKERRRGRQIGWKSGFKKALVQLKEGQRIETL